MPPPEVAIERLMPAGADPAAAGAERGEVTEPAGTPPETSEPAVELTADPPTGEPGAESIEPGLIRRVAGAAAPNHIPPTNASSRAVAEYGVGYDLRTANCADPDSVCAGAMAARWYSRRLARPIK